MEALRLPYEDRRGLIYGSRVCYPLMCVTGVLFCIYSFVCEDIFLFT